MSNEQEIHTYVGRFAPVHRGHEAILDYITSTFGTDHCLAVVGSSSSYNARTPYTYAERREMIARLYPTLKVIAIPDVKSRLTYFDGTTNSEWLGRIQRIEEKLGKKLIFYGGSTQDLSVLSLRFETHVPLNCDRSNLQISGTKVREALEVKDNDSLKFMINPRILDLVIMGYNHYHEQGN